jgi:hypothetical protein
LVEGAPGEVPAEEGWPLCCWLPFPARRPRRSLEDRGWEVLELELRVLPPLPLVDCLAGGRSDDGVPLPAGLPPEANKAVDVWEGHWSMVISKISAERASRMVGKF